MPIIRRISARDASAQRKDLSRDLQDRLTLLEAQEKAALAEVERIKEQKNLTARMLLLERQQNGTPVPVRERREIADIVRESLFSGVGPKALIVQAATESGYVAPARAVNAVLMGYLRHGLVTRTSDETYNLTGKGKDTLSKITEDFQ